MAERDIERYLCGQAKAMGGRALKWVSPGFAGAPDRIVILPHGRVAFAELKAPGKSARPLQTAAIRLLCCLGCRAEVIDSKPAVDALLRSMGGDAK